VNSKFGHATVPSQEIPETPLLVEVRAHLISRETKIAARGLGNRASHVILPLTEPLTVSQTRDHSSQWYWYTSHGKRRRDLSHRQERLGVGPTSRTASRRYGSVDGYSPVTIVWTLAFFHRWSFRPSVTHAPVNGCYPCCLVRKRGQRLGGPYGFWVISSLMPPSRRIYRKEGDR